MMHNIPEIILPIVTLTNYGSFINQPNNNEVKIYSDNVLDINTVTIWGLDIYDNIQYEEIEMAGTSIIITSRKNWKTIISIIISKKDGQSVNLANGEIKLVNNINETITIIESNNYISGMMILDLKNKNIEINVAYGNLYFTNLDEIPTYQTGIKIKGIDSKTYNIHNLPVKFISDNVGACMQLIISKQEN